MNWLLYEKGGCATSPRSKDSVLDDLSRVQSFVVECICTSTIEEEPAKPENKGADAQPHRTFFLKLSVRVLKFLDGIGLNVRHIFISDRAKFDELLNLRHLFYFVKLFELFFKELFVLGLTRLSEQEWELDPLEQVVARSTHNCSNETAYATYGVDCSTACEIVETFDC